MGPDHAAPGREERGGDGGPSGAEDLVEGEVVAGGDLGSGEGEEAEGVTQEALLWAMGEGSGAPRPWEEGLRRPRRSATDDQVDRLHQIEPTV